MFPQYKLQPQRQRKCYRFGRILNKNLPFHVSPVTKMRLHSILSRNPCKIFSIQCFFTDHLKHSTVNKTTCRTPSGDPCRTCRTPLGFPTLMIIFRDFQDFLIYLAKYLWSVLNSRNLTFQLPFHKSKVNKIV